MSPRPPITTMPIPAPDPEVMDYERALIGGCLADTRGSKVWPSLRPEEFFLDRHRLIWTGVLDLLEHTDHPTCLDLTAQLRRTDTLELAGGAGTIAEIIEAGIHVFDLAHYGRVVREAATTRAKVQFAATLAGHPDMSSAEIEQALRALESGSAAASLPASDVLATEQERLRKDPPLYSGLHGLDAMLHGFPRSKVIAVGARTSHGKSTFTTFLAHKFAKRGTAVDYITLEESDADIIAKLVAIETGIPVWKLLSHEPLEPEDQTAADAAALGLEALPLSVLTMRSHYEADVLAEVARSQADVVIVDHIQQILTDGDSRVYGLERVMSRLGAIAVADRKCVIVTAQINRSIDARREAPTLNDLRDSGGIEQAARVVLLLYWPWKHDAEKPKADYEVHVAKAMNGPTGIVHLTYSFTCGRFSGGDS